MDGCNKILSYINLLKFQGVTEKWAMVVVVLHDRHHPCPMAMDDDHGREL